MSDAYQCDIIDCKKFVAGETKSLDLSGGDIEDRFDLCDECYNKIVTLFVKMEPVTEELPKPAEVIDTPNPQLS